MPQAPLKKLWLQHSWVNNTAQTATEKFAVYAPASGALLAEVSEASPATVNEAVDAAHQALPAWRNTPSQQREQTLRQWASSLSQHREYLATLICHESGKVYREAEAEIQACCNALHWYAGECRRLAGQYLGEDSTLQRFTCKQSIGVVACITPWNFPAAAVVVKVGAALAAGCTAVLKPSEHTPLIAMALAWLAQQAGLPAGCFNLIASSRPSVFSSALESPKVTMLSFTGSTAVGQQLYRQCAPTVKRLALELGGNAPFIVFEDSNIPLAVQGLMAARFYNAGQICVGANRVYVQQNIYEAFAAALCEQVRALQVGDGFQPHCQIGPLISKTAAERLQQLVDDACAQGASLLCGGELNPEQVQYYPPSVLTNMQDTMAACHQEIFGPVACLYRFQSEAEVLARANASPAGLAAYVYTGNSSRLMRVSHQLEAGTLGANSTQLFADNLPFGGIKQSGLGREHGAHCLDEYLETKSITIGHHP